MSLKQGLMQLREYTRIKGMKFHQDDKGIIIPIYSFINQLVTSIKSFLNTQQYPYWYIYIVNQHIRDRSFPNIIKSWQKLSITSLECHLLQSLLIINNKNKLKLYLKARKFIIQTASNSAMLDQILLNVQDAISVIHKIYSNQHIRKALAQGIKNIFMAFKLTQAKIYSSVFIQYLLTVYDSVFRIEHDQATISGNFSNYKSYENSSNYVELYSSISNFQSGMHDENGLYKKTNFTQNTPKKYQIIDRKFIPLKQTSQFVYYQNPNSYNNKSSLTTKKQFKYSPQKQKSSFYDFISHSTQQQNHQVSHQQSTIQQINSFSKSYQKQQRYFLQKQAIQKKRNENSMGNKENNNMKSYKISLQRESRTQATKPNKKFSLNRQQTINNNSNNNNETMSKNFSLNWFSKKVFETSGGGGNDDQKQSVLRRQKQRMKRKVDQRKKLHIASADSTQQYQIENHLIGQNNNNMSQISNKNNNRQSISQQQRQSHNNKSNNRQQHHQQLQLQYQQQQQSSQAQSVKRQQFQIMVSKNQQFKWKMLKKNYPSNSNTSNNSQYTMNSQHIDDNLQQHQKQQQQQQNDDYYDGQQLDFNQQQISGHGYKNNNSNDNCNGYNPEFMVANSTFSRVKRQLQLQQSDEGQSMSMSRGNFSYNINNNKNKNINNNQPQPKQHQHQSMLKRDTLYYQYQQLINSAVSPQIMTVKQRADNNNNKSKTLTNNNNNVNNHNDVIMSMSKNSINNNKTNSIQKYPNFIKKTYSKKQHQQQNNEQQQDQSYKQQKPQIIHKSINKSRLNNFSNNNSTLQKHLLQSQQQQQQSNSEYDHRQSQQSQYSQQKSSFDINKMKKMISIIDNYRNNNNNKKKKNKSQQQEQYQSSNINISASNCKKSNFHSSSIQKDYEEIQDYSFY